MFATIVLMILSATLVWLYTDYKSTTEKNHMRQQHITDLERTYGEAYRIGWNHASTDRENIIASYERFYNIPFD